MEQFVTTVTIAIVPISAIVAYHDALWFRIMHIIGTFGFFALFAITVMVLKTGSTDIFITVGRIGRIGIIGTIVTNRQIGIIGIVQPPVSRLDFDQSGRATFDHHPCHFIEY